MAKGFARYSLSITPALAFWLSGDLTSVSEHWKCHLFDKFRNN
jgi:hypothetical protein